MLPYSRYLKGGGRKLMLSDVDNKKQGYKILIAVMPFVALLVALFLGGVLIFSVGINPWKAYGYMFRSLFSNIFLFSETFVHFVPLLFCSLSFAVGVKGQFINIGIEGQLYFGALIATLAGIYIQCLPAFIHIPLVLLAGVIGGVFLFGIAGILKIKFGVDEIISTLMLNYLAIFLVDFMVTYPLKPPNTYIPQSEKIAESARLLPLIAGTQINLGLILSLLVAVIIYYYVYRSPYGYQIRVVGASSNVAKYAGIDILKSTISVIIIAGGLAGLAGASMLIGAQHKLVPAFSSGYGFQAICTSVLAKNNPLWIILTALLFSFIQVGVGSMHRNAGVPLSLCWVIQGMIMVMITSSEYLTSKFSANLVGGRA